MSMRALLAATCLIAVCSAVTEDTRRRLAQAGTPNPFYGAPAPAPALAAPAAGFPAAAVPAALGALGDAGLSALQDQLLTTMTPSELCGAAKQLYGTDFPQCVGVPPLPVKKTTVTDVPTGAVRTDPEIDALQGKTVTVTPLTSGVSFATARHLLTAGAAAAAACLLL